MYAEGMALKVTGFDKVKYGFMVIGTAAGGMLMMFGPQEMREQVPIHFELGVGFFVLSLLMIAALYSTRAKAFLVTLISGAVAAGVIFVAINAEDWPMWQRALFGLLGAGSALFAVFSLISVFRGEDPA